MHRDNQSSHPAQEVLVVQQSPQSPALHAICNVCVPELGQVLQGRLVVAVRWYIAACRVFARAHTEGYEPVIALEVSMPIVPDSCFPVASAVS